MALIGANLGLVVWTAVLVPVALVVYRLVTMILDVKRRGEAVDRFPHDAKHWLWGHIHLFPGPNEKGLEVMRSRASRYPRAYSLWRGFMMPHVVTVHPTTAKYPGPNEAGLKFQRDHVSKYPRAQGVWIGNWIRPSVLVHHFETVKVILKSSEPKPLGFGVYGYGRRWLGDGLLLSKGAKWLRNRRLLTPAFHFDILKGYVNVKNESTEIFLNKLLKSVEEGHKFEFFSHISLLTFDIILRCACSYEDNVQVKGDSHPYVQAVNSLSDLWVKRTLRPWLHFDFIYNLTKDSKEYHKHCEFVHSISDEVIQKRKEAMRADAGSVKQERYRDFLDVLLMAKDEDGKGLTDQEIQDEVDTFLFEGHDTTASAISWALYSIAEHPEVQRRCQTEIDSILDDGNHSGDTIRWEDLNKLQYLSMCIKESMRLHCPVPFIQRQIDNELTIDGITLPKGSVIDVNIYNLHHNEAVWEEPMKFRPERFLPEELEKKDNYAFIPFSAGPRNCIGQQFAMHEQKVVLARILRKFTFELDPNFVIKKKLSLVMRTETGLYLKAIPRN